MRQDRLFRFGLFASVAVNAAAVCFVGYASTLKPSIPIVAVPKPLPTRLIEIKTLTEEKAIKLASSGGSGGKGGEGKGSSGSGGESNDSGLGAKKGLDKVALTDEPTEKTRELPPKPKSPNAKPRQASKLKPRPERRPNEKRDVKVAVHADQKIDLGLVKLRRPGRLITGGYHGIVDLRKLKLTARLLAMLNRSHAKLLPDKLIGKGHIQVIGKLGKGAVCVPTGGHTIYGSDLKIYLGKDIELSGTKFCVPGGFPGIPGNASQTNPRGNITSLAKPKSEGGGLDGSAQNSLEPSSVESHRPIHETDGDPAGSNPTPLTQLNGRRANDSTGSAERSGSSVQGGGDVVSTDSDLARQQQLQAQYERYASGPLRGVDDKVGEDLNAIEGVSRRLHLPARHQESPDRMPGVSVPKEDQKLVDSPKPHEGSSSQDGNADFFDKSVKFQTVPTSVGSHSLNGSIPWPVDAPKRKKSRKVRGDGKKDGGGDGTGLMGEYFKGTDFQTEVLRRPDRDIDFDWSNRPVDPKMQISKNFSVRWTGFIQPRFTETYKIYAASDDGERIWIDGKLLISDWTLHGPNEDIGLIDFVAGRKYSIKIEYFENDIPPAVMKLYWESAHQVKEYVPQSCLYYPAPKR